MQKKIFHIAALMVGIVMLISVLPVTTRASATSFGLPIGVYTNMADEPTIQPVLQKYYTSPNDIVFPPNNLESFEFTTFPNHQNTIDRESLSDIQSSISFANQNNVVYIATDALAFDNASKIIHAAGLKFAYNPTLSYFKDHYTKLDWTKCDMLYLPFSGLITTSSKYTTDTTSAVNFVKSKNPNILIYDTVNLDSASPQQITTAVQGVRSYIDGVLVKYMTPCTYCTPANLDQTLQGLTGAQVATPPPSTVSQAPTNLVATASSSSQINLGWNAPSNNGGSPITGYQIERSSNGGSSWSVITSTSGSASTYSDTGLTAGTSYSYRVSAINSVGTSSASNTASATTLSAITSPQVPTNLSATAASSSQIDLSWIAPSNDGGSAITGYAIEQSTDSGSTWSTIVSNTGTTSTTYSNTGLAASTSYTYRVSAINSIGTSSASNIASATTLSAITSPQSPTNLSATASSSSQINLGWNAPSNNGGSPITGYQIERSSNGGSSWSVITSTSGSASTYSDTGLTAGTSYSYRVSAINSVGTSSASNTASATTSAATSSSSSSRISLLFVEWPTPQDTPMVQSLMLQYETQSNDYSHIKSDNFYLNLPHQRQFSVGDSLAAVSRHASEGPKISLPVFSIAYDFEHWTATPASEQADPLGSMATASDIVRNAGYKFAYAPDGKYIETLYNSIDWTKVDIAWIQTGHNANTYSGFVSFETSVVNKIRSENPNAIIIVQISLAHMKDSTFANPVAQYNAEVDYLVNHLKVDGVSVVYTTPADSPNFTIPNLQAILAHISATPQYVHN